MHKVQKMNITLVCVGTVKEKFLTDAIKEYTKRLAPFCRFKMCEVAECTLAKKFSNADILSALANEKAKILLQQIFKHYPFTCTPLLRVGFPCFG